MVIIWKISTVYFWNIKYTQQMFIVQVKNVKCQFIFEIPETLLKCKQDSVVDSYLAAVRLLSDT